MKRFFTVCLLVIPVFCFTQSRIVVFQTDFGLKDGAVSEMKGVAITVFPDLKLFDLTHEIPAFNIWEASYRLEQTVRYWPEGTVFVSVVDPGVGTQRKSVVLLTNSGHYIVTPDNGTLTHIARSLGIKAIREIDESENRRQGSGQSYTFHGRDVYSFTAARLAAGVISFEQVGPEMPNQVVSLPFQDAVIKDNTISGIIPILDTQYGNVWTNIPAELFKKLNVGEGEKIKVVIYHSNKVVHQSTMPFEHTFGKLPEGKPLVYLNSLLQLSFAINKGNFARQYHIDSGNEWSVKVSKAE